MDEIITSAQNPRVKTIVKLRKRSCRDESGLLLVEGYRETRRALDNQHPLNELYYCRELFLGDNEDQLIADARTQGAGVYECGELAFRKMAYRDRPDGILAVGPQVKASLSDLSIEGAPLILAAEQIEKPGNLGTILRSADAAAVDAVVVCDRCTDINNPNVVRASVGTLFTLPVIETSTAGILEYFKDNCITIISATPDSDLVYTDADMTGSTAIVVGAEQYGLSAAWFGEDCTKVRIPMLGKCDSLNVGTAAAILLYEAVRQRSSIKENKDSKGD